MNNSKIIPTLPDRKSTCLKNTKSVSYIVDIVDNTKMNININASKTRNQFTQTNLSTKINSKMISKNQSKVNKYLINFRTH
jgi:hypothetical protein